MSYLFKIGRRRFITTAATTLITGPFTMVDTPHTQDTKATPVRTNQTMQHYSSMFETIKQIDAGVLNVGYAELGPPAGMPVILLHGWPYDIRSYGEVATILAAKGCRVLIPYLRGHGTTKFLKSSTARSGQQAALGSDLIAFMDALHIKKAVLAGYDWGGRAACVAAALWPERCIGLISVNSYLIQDIAKSWAPISPKIEAGFWYQFYFLTERGRAGLTINKREIIELMWARNSPNWHFTEQDFNQSMAAFDNPDYVTVVIHSYRHRLGFAEGAPEYNELEKQLAKLPVITVPTITLDGDSDGVVPPTDGRSSAAKFGNNRQHRIISNAGHNLPQETPATFAAAIWEIASKNK